MSQHATVIVTVDHNDQFVKAESHPFVKVVIQDETEDREDSFTYEAEDTNQIDNLMTAAREAYAFLRKLEKDIELLPRHLVLANAKGVEHLLGQSILDMHSELQNGYKNFEGAE